jgi:hypothetical protein
MTRTGHLIDRATDIKVTYLIGAMTLFPTTVAMTGSPGPHEQIWLLYPRDREAGVRGSGPTTKATAGVL